MTVRGNDQQKTLVIIRHAQAEHGLGVADHERTLSATGAQDAPEAGKWLLTRGLIPDQIITSDAVRTRQTTTWILSELGEQAVTPALDPRLYEATAAQALSVINETEESVRTLCVVGHMPWVQDLGMRLASVASDEQSVIRMAEHYPTLGIQVFEISARWAELDGRDARMVDFIAPRG
ncbi:MULTISPECIES: SixA phosphatase family protein [Auritidibacter]|uniref:SixA phosphatase family protein n=1 Tax=Auritidibacter TaxID=1160973 RepID=UPI000D735530|nr:histidine phosphatase family protein [Auritidibacter sp. NML100628]PXA75584.1 histidine phosphatase [Auritidibacter sp. NML100628]